MRKYQTNLTFADRFVFAAHITWNRQMGRVSVQRIRMRRHTGCQCCLSHCDADWTA